MATSTEKGLDTSVVLRLLVGEPEEQNAVAVGTLRAARKNGYTIRVSDLVVAETYFALQAAYQVPKKDALRALLRMFESGDVLPEPGGCALDILHECGGTASKPGFVDRMIHAQYRRHGAEMLTFEKAAKKLPGTQLLSSVPPNEE